MRQAPAAHTLAVQGLERPMPIATGKGSVPGFQGWAKTNKPAKLVGQETLVKVLDT